MAESQKDQEHIPVMAAEVIEAMDGFKVGLMVDGTVGSGGHSASLLEAYPTRNLLGIDMDRQALGMAEDKLRRFGSRVELVHGSYADISTLAGGMGDVEVCGVLLDLGLSSMQIDNHSRGFSFKNNGVLDMRFDQSSQGKTAQDILNEYPEDDLSNLFYEFGEEPRSRKIAAKLVKNRPIYDTEMLADLIASMSKGRRKKVHPATRVFQALRIAVNEELDNVQKGLKEGESLLRSGGKLVVITYHSLEDRLVKRFFRRESARCVCPSDSMICDCEHQPMMKVLTRKVIKPSMNEVKNNSRCRSAKLRVAEKL